MVITTTMQRYWLPLAIHFIATGTHQLKELSKCCCFSCNDLRLFGLQGTLRIVRMRGLGRREMKDFNEFLDLICTDEKQEEINKITLKELGRYMDSEGCIKREEMNSAFLNASKASSLLMLKFYHQWVFEQ